MQPEDLLKFGLIPEFVGRLPVIATLGELDEDALVRILTEPKNALVRQYQKLFDMENVHLKFTQGALRAISREALKRKSGARGLRAIMEAIMVDLMYEIPSQPNIKEVLISEEVVTQKEQPLLVYQKDRRNRIARGDSTKQMLFRNDKDKNNKKAVATGRAMRFPLLPLRELIVFPHQVYPIFVGRQKSIKALEAAEARRTTHFAGRAKGRQSLRSGSGRTSMRSAPSAWWCSCCACPTARSRRCSRARSRARIVRYAAEDEYFQVEVEPKSKRSAIARPRSRR